MSNQRKRQRRPRCIFPEYRWCGPGCSGPGMPINDVDACCQKHDLCLDSGRSSCDCDRAFVECLRPKMNRETEKGRNAAFMYKIMKLKMMFTCGG
ncbi:phospholipase [Metabacillus indicus]|uniref:phospholipase n=1 Tax=Metabacillus indicus TaxID=246786 RepID=UPI0031737715